MANKDLVKKKRTVNLDTATYELLSKFTGSLREANGGFVSMNAAVAVLLDHWQRVQVQGNTITIATPEQLEAHDKQFIHQYPGGSFDAGKALEYIFNKSNETK